MDDLGLVGVCRYVSLTRKHKPEVRLLFDKTSKIYFAIASTIQSWVRCLNAVLLSMFVLRSALPATALSALMFLALCQHWLFSLGIPVVLFSPFYFGVSLIKLDIRKKGTLLLLGYWGT